MRLCLYAAVLVNSKLDYYHKPMTQFCAGHRRLFGFLGYNPLVGCTGKHIPHRGIEGEGERGHPLWVFVVLTHIKIIMGIKSFH